MQLSYFLFKKINKTVDVLNETLNNHIKNRDDELNKIKSNAKIIINNYQEKIDNNTKEINDKISAKFKGRKTCHTPEIRRIISIKMRDLRLEETRNKTFDEVGIGIKKKRILQEQNGCCLNCGLTHWMGEPIKFEIDHIDGNNSNNLRENLRVLCPNCHSLTPTWRKKKTTRLEGAGEPIRLST